MKVAEKMKVLNMINKGKSQSALPRNFGLHKSHHEQKKEGKRQNNFKYVSKNYFTLISAALADGSSFDHLDGELPEEEQFLYMKTIKTKAVKLYKAFFYEGTDGNHGAGESPMNDCSNPT